MKSYTRFIGDYLRDTLHLTMLQDGAYGRLLDAYYAHEKPLPLDLPTLYAMARATTPEECSAVDKMLAEFFKKTSLGFTNKRAEKYLKEIINWRKRQKNHRDRKRDKQRDSNGNCHANVTVSPSPSPSPSLKIKKEERENIPPAKPLGEYAGFAVFYEAYPKKLGKKEARKAWIKTLAEEHLGEVLASLVQWKKTHQWQEVQYIPYPARFLNAEMWKEDPLAVVGVKGVSLDDERKRIEKLAGIG